MQPQNKFPKLLVSPPSPGRKRLSIEETMMSKAFLKQDKIPKLDSVMSSPNLSRICTESTPTHMFSVSDFWRAQQLSPKTLVFVNQNQDKDVINRYLSKVLINLNTNIMKAFIKLIRPSQHQLFIRKGKKENKWFKISANIFALNSKINEQKGLWRLKGVEQVPQKLSYHKNVQIVVYPQQYISLQPKLRAITQLEDLVKTQNLKKAVICFRKNSRNFETKRRYLLKCIKNHQLKYQTAFLIIKCLPNVKKNRKYLSIKSNLEKYFVKQISKRHKQVFQVMKASWRTGQLKKCAVVSQMSRTVYRNGDKAISKWCEFSKHENQKIKRQKLQTIFKIIQQRQQKSFSVIFNGFNPNLRNQIKQKLDKIMKISNSFQRYHLKKAVKKWRKRQNEWFNRAVKLIALNTILNQQTTLWRLKQTVN